LSFYNKLYDFQKESLKFGIEKHGRLLLADEMGVGKSIQSLAIASIYRYEWPLLIICPSSLRLNWQQEVLNWLDIKKPEIQVYNKGGTLIRENIKILIISY
jgi:SWI/SNF-related matrix-associated actin-dependent regulator 1 of chromatin subfamily A